MIPWLAIVALAVEVRPFRQDDTLDAVAVSLGDPALVSEIRSLNGLGDGEVPEVGTLLKLPPPDVPHADQQVFLLSTTGAVTVGGAPAQVYTPIPADTAICTGDDGFAALRVATQCTPDGQEADDLSLLPGTCVTVVSAFGSIWGRSAVLDLSSGSLVISEGSAAAGNVTVTTDAGWTTGSDGGFRVNVEDAAMRAEALYARVAVQGNGVEVALDAAQGSRVEEGKAPSAPVDLLVAGALYLPGDGEPMRKPLFTWEPSPKAFGYRLEIAADRAFEDQLFLEEVPAAEMRPETLALPGDGGGLYWRIAPLDPFGFLGVPSLPRALRVPRGVGK